MDPAPSAPGDAPRGAPELPSPAADLLASAATRAPGRRAFPFTAILLGVSLVIALAVLLRLVDRAAQRLPFFRVDAARNDLVGAPAWMPAEWLAEARARIGAQGSFSIFDDDAAAAMRAELAGLPWVRSVREVERALPRTVRLAVEPRLPLALVEDAGASVLVDADGVVLPPASFAADQLRAVPRIARTRGSFRAAKAGKRWDDDAVLDGVSLALLLPAIAARVPTVAIVRIDVTNSGGAVDPRETEILLATSTGVRIKWGRAPRAPKYGEIPVEAKLANLERVERQYPGLGGLGLVSLRFDEPDLFDANGQWIQPPTAMASGPAPASAR